MLIDQIQNDLKGAMRTKDVLRVSTLRLLLSELNYARIDKSDDLTAAESIVVVQREMKKRKEAAEGFRLGGREDQAKKEEAEAVILTDYLPVQLTDEDLEKIIDEVLTQTGAVGVSDMGKVIGIVMGKIVGQAEGSRVSMLVKEKLK